MDSKIVFWVLRGYKMPINDYIYRVFTPTDDQFLFEYFSWKYKDIHMTDVSVFTVSAYFVAETDSGLLFKDSEYELYKKCEENHLDYFERFN